ncbi:MAG TPA: class II aldolase/adducin family protein [Armatimonadota bacterium]|nr:class II aldolase/adducin family protein [Armatimonadota bacterium]
MASKSEILHQLVEMSHRLGEESRGLVILGEGNTSARIGDDTFYVKASGIQLGTIPADGFVEVDFAKVLEMLEYPELTDEQIKARLRAATVDPKAVLMPSIETVFHAYLLSLPGVDFVGHTHPVSVNAILCSNGWCDATQGRLFPDEIVCCGLAPAYVEYTDPGVPLARRIREVVTDYIEEKRERPKAILMQNHGLIAIGSSAKEVESITIMWDKTARVTLGTFQFGGPNYLSKTHVERIHTRPDEAQRKKLIEGK